MTKPSSSIHKWSVLKIPLIYFAISVCWILFSDLLMASVGLDPERIALVSILKGWAFVLVTSLILWGLVYRHTQQILKANRDINASRENLLAIIEASPLPVIELDLEGRVLLWNRSAERVFGWTQEETLGHVLPTVAPDKTSEFFELLNLLKMGEKLEGISIRRMAKNGVMRDLHIYSAPVHDASGRMTSIVSIMEDVTTREKARRDLIEHKEILQAILDNAPIMTAFLDPNGGLKWVNRAWEQKMGWTLDEARQRHIIEDLYPDPAMRERVREFIRKSESKWSEFVSTTRNGDPILAIWINTRLSDGSRISIGLDITERKRLEEQLLQAQKMESIGRLAGGVAHDFNNLLMVMQGNTEFVLNRVKDSENIEDLESVLKAVERATALTHQLLAFSRRQIMQVETVDLNDLIESAGEMLKRMIGEDVECLVTPMAPLWKVRVDPQQIEHVLFNLAVNARDAMPNGGHLTIETANVALDSEYAHAHPEAPSGDYVMLAVSDMGGGIPPEIVDKIFEPFFTTKPKGRGTGLGLSTVHGIVKQSGGHIFVYSEPGKGTTIKIYLPRAVDEPAREPAERGSDTVTAGHETILAVEDAEGVLAILERTLSSRGYSVITAQSGGDALTMSRLHDGRIDLLVTDLIMPGMNGKELANQLSESRPETKILFISGYTDNAIVHHGMLDEGVNFLQKPFTAPALLAKVREVLDRD
ncbi:MAG: PAS domain S-box protein [bacterium]|nr:PAS domain S-box protein [bacterium]